MGSDYRKLVDAEAAAEQLSLFDLMGQSASRQKRERLEATVEDLKKKYGDGSVTLGIQENADIGLQRKKMRRPFGRLSHSRHARISTCRSSLNI